MPNQIEPNANNALGSLLRGMFSSTWKVFSENTRTFPDYPGRHADVLVTAAGRSPVVVEAEYEPGAEVEKDATERLGLRVGGEPRTIEAAVALKYPQAVEEAYDVSQAVAEAQLSYCVLHEDGSRFPESGWLSGSVTDLADLIRLVSVPQKEVDAAAAALELGIGQAANVLEDMAKLRPNITPAIARLLGMIDVPQTRRMACAIIANAMIFHQRIYGIHAGVKQLHLVCGPAVADPQGETLVAWTDILKINYWPIFAIAKDILEQLPSDTAAQLLHGLLQTAQQVNATGVDNAHDLTGRVFQRLIADRKYLATFYTLPASAALLARLAVAKMEGVDWSNAEAIGKLRIGDFACGTGALLSAVYEEIASRHERAGGDPAALHPVMMEEVLYGCDVMPSAIHITGSTLSGVEPSVGFGRSRLYTMPYGKQPDATVKIGSLELLQSSATLTLFNTSDPAMRTGSVGEETATQVLVDVPDEGFDLIIMNPPFTSNTAKDAPHVGIFAPAFAAFQSKDEDQRAMAKRLGGLKEGTCYHGHAGMASAFATLAHRKLKPGGILALVLPLTAAAASSWLKFREMLAQNYQAVTIVSIAANDKDMTFSSDTGIAECLVVARKVTEDNLRATRAHFVCLRHTPLGAVHANAIFHAMGNPGDVRGIETGPYGGTPIRVGGEEAGEAISEQHPSDGKPWRAVRVADSSLAQTAYALTQCRLWLPAQNDPRPLSVAALASVGFLGLYDLDIIGKPPQGPFDKGKYSPTATYPALWNHNAKAETRLVCRPDSQLYVRVGMEQKAGKVWATATRAHLARGFRFTSQPLCVAITEAHTMGGTAWPNVGFPDSRFDNGFALWCNSTLGLLLFWWNAGRQQSGRGWMSIRSADAFPVLDFRTLSNKQLQTSERIFEEFRDKDLHPAYLADADPNRALLDRRVVCDLLGFDEETYMGVRRLAAKWCAEPSVHGGKARPKWAKFVA